MRRFLLFGLLIFLFPMTTNALMCPNADKVNFQEMAKNITTTYDYVESNGTASFQITLSNIPTNFIIKEAINGTKHPYSGSSLTVNNYESGKTYRFDVYVDDVNCFLERLYSIYVTVPFYNQYYQDEICKGIESYKYCQKWQSNTFTYEEFVKNVESYKKSLIKEEKPEKEIKESIFDKILDFYIDYYFVILPVIILAGMIYTHYYNKKHDLF